MKILFKITLIVSLLLSNVVANAVEVSFLLKVKAGREKSIVFQNEKSQKFKLTVSSLEEGVLYENNMSVAAGAKTTYDLASFPNGNYSFKLQTATDLTTYDLVIKDGKVEVGEPVVTTFIKPEIVSNNGVVSFSLDGEKYQQLAVEIYNGYNQKLYSDVYKGKANLKKTFNIDKANGRELTFVVKADGQEYVKTLALY
ncbi:MAG: hypothetical protein EOO96_21795 [Pedobacter sp.]|nr:MAG: hypothetical protein EOO96_21795 [Pedobacter sp.]